MPEERIAPVAVTRIAPGSVTQNEDVLAVEEPLEIRVACEGREKNISVTMRTPGDDYDLAAGFLFTEALIRSAEDIESPEDLVHSADGALYGAKRSGKNRFSTVRVVLPLASA